MKVMVMINPDVAEWHLEPNVEKGVVEIWPTDEERRELSPKLARALAAQIRTLAEFSDEPEVQRFATDLEELADEVESRGVN